MINPRKLAINPRKLAYELLQREMKMVELDNEMMLYGFHSVFDNSSIEEMLESGSIVYEHKNGKQVILYLNETENGVKVHGVEGIIKKEKRIMTREEFFKKVMENKNFPRVCISGNRLEKFEVTVININGIERIVEIDAKTNTMIFKNGFNHVISITCVDYNVPLWFLENGGVRL